MPLDTIGVVGAGQMGNGIAHVAASSGHEVLLADVEDRFLEKGLAVIEKNLDREVARGKRSGEEKRDTLSRIRSTTDLSKLEAANFVIEAVVEDETVKKGIFSRLDAICPPATIFASNTSSISITRLAASTKRPERFVGMHFMNPV
ncbi:MAG TPA: 3-hydroxyacyl-CoA dehydrogenase NAD-binding domain-containing protein, partial [Thermoanaerobaculia bacterium]